MIPNRYIDGTYLEKVQDWHVHDSKYKASKVFQMIEKNHLVFNSVYDIGCGAGEILVELQKKINGHERLAGFDISPQAIGIAKSKENATLKFYNEDFLQSKIVLPDLLLLLDVFEHIPDYLGFLDAMRRKTNWIIFHIPLDMCAYTILRKSNYLLENRKQFGHLHYFSKETSLATISESGFEIVDYFYTTDHEIGGASAFLGFKATVYYQIRKIMYRFTPDLAAAVLPHFNLMVLARGDRKQTAL
jgi:predicted TPR repeat methyltransferase